ncbi:hypothetical protein Q3G72_030064 [Acer saccharum]|nr:hypothetical protein Q3G72_030064 [Acer saccharum]
MNGSNISRSSHEAIESSSSEEPSPPCPLVPLTMTEGGLRLGINGNYISCSSYEDVESPPCPLVHFTMTEGGNDDNCFECNYCGQLIDCGSENDGSCVLWDHLGNDCEEYKNRVVDEKQNILSFDTKECDSSCGSSLEKEKEAIIVENFTRGIKELLFHLFDVYNALDTSHGVQSSNDVQPLNGMDVEKEKYRHDLFAEFKKFRETKGCTEDAHAHVLAFEDSYFER